MTTAIPVRDKDALMRLFDVGYHGWVEEEEPYQVSLPDGWRTSRDLPPWVLVHPAEPLWPDQGWKIHVSAVPDTAQQSLTVVSEIAFSSNVSFKYLSGAAELRRENSKYADRGSAGKFITLYPGESELATVIYHLEEALSDFEGPYVLSDAQYGSAPVYVRYGGFIDVNAVEADGTERLCLRDPEGRLVEDKRGPFFEVPDFVNVPECIHGAVTERLNPTDDSLTRLLDGYELVNPIHFSNGGGVYHLKRLKDGTDVIMKEGRPNAGWDPQDGDAASRIRREAATLQALSRGRQVTPEYYGLRSVGGHLFLFEEKIDGEDLHSWMAKNYPRPGSLVDTDRYAEDALSILGRLEDALEAVHRLGMAVMDLQPRNILVTPDNEVRLIDMESACPVGDKKPRARIGAPGYVPTVHSYSPRERDYYALLQVALNLFHPAAGIAALSDSASYEIKKIVGDTFPPRVGERLAGLQQRAAPAMSCAHVHRNNLKNCPDATAGCASIRDDGDESLSTQNLVEGLRRGIHLVRTARNTSAEHPSFYPLASISRNGMSQLAVEHGLAGVMLALGPCDANAEEDLLHLVDGSFRVRQAGSGLMNGMLGICLLLASRGCAQEALDLYYGYCINDAGANNISLRSGLSGRVLGSLILATIIDDDEVASYSDKLLDRLRGLVVDPPENLDSPESFTQEPLGLLDGWSGAALAMAAAAHMYREPVFYRYAVEAIRLDMLNMTTGSGGGLQAVDGRRLMPYLADGSGGLGFALTTIPDQYRGDYDDALDGVFEACRGYCAFSGLYHGMSGLVLLSMLMARTRKGSGPGRSGVGRLSPYLVSALDSGSLFTMGEDGEHLSIELAGGSAGALLALRFMRAHSALVGSPGSSRFWNLADIVNVLREGR